MSEHDWQTRIAARIRDELAAATTYADGEAEPGSAEHAAAAYEHLTLRLEVWASELSGEPEPGLQEQAERLRFAARRLFS